MKNQKPPARNIFWRTVATLLGSSIALWAVHSISLYALKSKFGIIPSFTAYTFIAVGIFYCCWRILVKGESNAFKSKVRKFFVLPFILSYLIVIIGVLYLGPTYLAWNFKFLVLGTLLFCELVTIVLSIFGKNSSNTESRDRKLDVTDVQY